MSEVKKDMNFNHIDTNEFEEKSDTNGLSKVNTDSNEEIKEKLTDEIQDNAIEELLILKQTIEEKNELIEKLKKENEENKDLLIRLKADFENYKKRVREEQKDMVKFSNQRLITDLLPILDDFDRALDSASDEIKNSSFFEGLNMVVKSFHNILEKKYFLESIEGENIPFDPHFHEAISVIEDQGIEGMVVIKTLQKGYKIDSRVLRSAKVVVKKGVEKAKNIEIENKDNNEIKIDSAENDKNNTENENK